MTLRNKLSALGACSDALEWVGTRTLRQAWASCQRADWMLWLLGRMAGKPGWPTRQQVVMLACDCAETAIVHVPAGEDRPRIAIDTARRWSRGEATLDQVRAAAKTAAADAAAYAAAASGYDAAAYAAYAAAAYAAAASGYADYAAAASAADYASAAVGYTADTPYTDARMAHLATMADAIRAAVKPGRIF